MNNKVENTENDERLDIQQSDMQSISHTRGSVFREVILNDKYLKISLFFTLFFVIVSSLWLTFAKLDEGIIASGSIVVDTKRRVIQHLEGGIIKKMNVKESSEVKAGDVLVVLDDTQARSRKNQAESRLLSSLAYLNRMEAERALADYIRFDKRLVERKMSPNIQELISVQSNLFEARKNNLDIQNEILQQRILQLNDKIVGLRGSLKALSEQRDFAIDEIENYEKLEAKQRIDKRAKTSKQIELSRLDGEVSRIQAEIASTKIAVNETRQKIIQVRSDFEEELSAEIAETQDKVFEYEDSLILLDDILDRTLIKAPTDGTVLNFRFSTIGGVIPPGEALMEIIPVDDTLVVEARINAIDIEHVYAGARVRAILSGYNQREVPELSGEVEWVSADVNEDKNTGMQYYLARIIFAEGEIAKLEGAEILPGMPVEIFVFGGQRTTLEYLIEPIQDVIRKGLREP